MDDWRALDLPAPLEDISPARWTACYEGTIGEKVGVFRSDGRVLVPFICKSISFNGPRFCEFGIDGVHVFMDRSGRLITPGGETTWAALGAPGFVPGQRAASAVAEQPK